MASGYKDYRRTVTPEGMYFGPEQIPVLENNLKEIGFGDIEAIITYNIPEGYDLHLLNLIVTSKMPGINRLWIDWGPTDTYIVFFDTTLNINFGADTIFLRSIDNTVYIAVENLDTVDIYFWATMTGFLTLTEV